MAKYGKVIYGYGVIKNGNDHNIAYPIISAEKDYPCQLMGLSLAGGDASEYVAFYVVPPGKPAGLTIDGRKNSVCVAGNNSPPLAGGATGADTGTNSAPSAILGGRDSPQHIIIPAGYQLMFAGVTASNVANWNAQAIGQSIIG